MRKSSVVAVFTLLGCGARDPSAVAWPEADAALRGSPAWRGGDAAYSVPLPDDRVLWLFGDSFVGAGDGGPGRGGRALVRNTLAVQSDPDPGAATFSFFQREEGAFFPPDGQLAYWPGPASRVGDTVLLTFVRVREVDAGLGFETVDSRALRVVDTEGPPTDWRFDPVALPETPLRVQLGLGAHLTEPPWLYAFAPTEPGDHDVMLARWRLTDVERGELGAVSWWNGNTWAEDGTAAPVVEHLQTEFSVSHVGDALWMVSTEGFGASDIVVRTASRPEGPWSEPSPLYRPPEYGRDGVLIYSAKVHPHLRGAPVVLTYCTNRLDFWALASDLDVYFPRFVRIDPGHER